MVYGRVVIARSDSDEAIQSGASDWIASLHYVPLAMTSRKSFVLIPGDNDAGRAEEFVIDAGLHRVGGDGLIGAGLRAQVDVTRQIADIVVFELDAPVRCEIRHRGRARGPSRSCRLAKNRRYQSRIENLIDR